MRGKVHDCMHKRHLLFMCTQDPAYPPPSHTSLPMHTAKNVLTLLHLVSGKCGVATVPGAKRLPISLCERSWQSISCSRHITMTAYPGMSLSGLLVYCACENDMDQGSFSHSARAVTTPIPPGLMIWRWATEGRRRMEWDRREQRKLAWVERVS